MKIQITIEGDDINHLIKDINTLLETNKDDVKKVLRTIAKEMFAVIEEDNILEQGADLYIKLTRTINDKYRQKDKTKS